MFNFILLGPIIVFALKNKNHEGGTTKDYTETSDWKKPGPSPSPHQATNMEQLSCNKINNRIQILFMRGVHC